MATIGELANKLNINVETIRFYQRKGLIQQPKKPLSGFRYYDETIADQLNFIIQAKTLGFTLQEISSLMSLDNDCQQVQSLSLQKLTLIREKINNLQKLEQVISQMTASCNINNSNENCPIIASLKSKTHLS